ncbi:MAG: TIGR03576 family pyridoxal phosphate-dependent enzyme, partial [Methanobacterium formicicum]|nr:TIGR03576 family pyridoxal phosphate-dependent enzyme [Methanobacterium formicicum]
STTIRLDLSAADARRLDDSQIINAIRESLGRVKEIADDAETCLSILYE